MALSVYCRQCEKNHFFEKNHPSNKKFQLGGRKEEGGRGNWREIKNLKPLNDFGITEGTLKKKKLITITYLDNQKLWLLKPALLSVSE